MNASTTDIPAFLYSPNRGMKPRTSTREIIYEIIQQEPGIHFRGICRKIGKHIGVVQYHTCTLQKFGVIQGEKDGRYMRFYPSGNRFDAITRQIIAALQRPVEKMILAVLVDGSRADLVKLIMDTLQISDTAVWWHVQRMKRNGVLIGDDTATVAIIPAGLAIYTRLMAKQGE